MFEDKRLWTDNLWLFRSLIVQIALSKSHRTMDAVLDSWKNPSTQQLLIFLIPCHAHKFETQRVGVGIYKRDVIAVMFLNVSELTLLNFAFDFSSERQPTWSGCDVLIFYFSG